MAKHSIRDRRRGWDLNPRYLAVQRFSRPSQSTELCHLSCDNNNKIKRTPDRCQPIRHCMPGGIRTPDLMDRNHTLYPAELRAHTFYCGEGGIRTHGTNNWYNRLAICPVRPLQHLSILLLLRSYNA